LGPRFARVTIGAPIAQAIFLLAPAAMPRKTRTMTQMDINDRTGHLPSEPVLPPRGHVLIADGDETSRQRRRLQLEAAGYRVSLARTSFEAIVKATCHVPDLILIDESLSDIEVEETGRMIRNCPVTAHIPIVRMARGGGVPARVFARRRVAVG
jgi:PleD family two-component response regulator